MIYISHKFDEVFRMSDRITVLRDGRTVGTDPTRDLDEPRIIARMVGREVGDIFPDAAHPRGEVVFEVRHMSVEDANVRGKMLVNNVSFAVKAGEVSRHRGADGRGAQRIADGYLRRASGARRAARFTSRASACESRARQMPFATASGSSPKTEKGSG